MIRAVFFDFYSVWTPDKIAYYVARAELQGPALYKELYDASEQYYQGNMSLDDFTGTLRYKLGATDIEQNTFKVGSSSISPEITKFMQGLHGHFVKVGILGNLGPLEYEVLKDFNDKNMIIEVIASPYSLGLKMPLLSKEIFDKTLEAIGETADSCLYVSGNPYNLSFARVLGLATKQFVGLEELITELDSLFNQNSQN
ncbi:MAG TPA: hypothetical protein VFN31_03050 [Candidatus Saccharimonadales bacterium]|nr:hypothetical protein [Candidatus Saccharimonadales bacterium]